jgi:dTDP-4-amino-4,6-dideoxygalactose transaminase
VYHTLVIQADRRDELRQYLLEKGVECNVHYPRPIHLQESGRTLGYHLGDFPVAERQSRHILSLPAYPKLTSSKRKLIIDAIRNFYQS